MPTHNRPISLPAQLVHRVGNGKRPAEAYIIEGSKRYVVGQSAKQPPKYYENVEGLLNAINNGSIDTLGKARIWLASKR